MYAQNRAIVNLFRGPNLIDDVAITMKQLERGDLKLRVRSLEAERALTRVEVSDISSAGHNHHAMALEKGHHVRCWTYL